MADPPPNANFTTKIAAGDFVEQAPGAGPITTSFQLPRWRLATEGGALYQTPLVRPAFDIPQAHIVFVPAECSDETWNVVESAPESGQAREEFKIHRDAVIAVEQQPLLNQAAAEERRRRRYVAAEIQQHLGIELVLDLGANDAALRIDEDAIPIQHVCLGMLDSSARNRLQAVGQVVIIGVEPADQVACRHQKAFVDRVGLAAVGLGDPAQMRMALE